MTLTCKIPSVGHQWHIQSLKEHVRFLNITRELLPSSEGRVISDHPFHFTVTEEITGNIISTVTVTATVDLNGTLVVCRDGVRRKTEQHYVYTIKLRGELFCMHKMFYLYVFWYGVSSEAHVNCMQV